MTDIDALARRLYDDLVLTVDEPEQSREVLKLGYLIMHGMTTDDTEGCRWCGGVPEVGRTGCADCLEARGAGWR